MSDPLEDHEPRVQKKIWKAESNHLCAFLPRAACAAVVLLAWLAPSPLPSWGHGPEQFASAAVPVAVPTTVHPADLRSLQGEDPATSPQIGMIISIAQAVVFVCLGPCTLLFGTLVEKPVVVIQALLASGYLDFIDTIVTATPMTAFDVFNSLLMLVSGTMAMAFATLKNRTGKLVMKGMVAGAMIANPLLDFAGTYLFQNLIGCTEIGAPTKEFPKGKPENCSNSGPTGAGRLQSDDARTSWRPCMSPRGSRWPSHSAVGSWVSCSPTSSSCCPRPWSVPA